MTWTEPAVTRLVKLWRAGESNTDIRKDLYERGLGDYTERAISGKGRRMGLGKRGHDRNGVKQRPMASGTSKGCQWIKKEDPPFLNAPRCGKRTIQGRSWCPECAGRVYSNPMDL